MYVIVKERTARSEGLDSYSISIIDFSDRISDLLASIEKDISKIEELEEKSVVAGPFSNTVASYMTKVSGNVKDTPTFVEIVYAVYDLNKLKITKSSVGYIIGKELSAE